MLLKKGQPGGLNGVAWDKIGGSSGVKLVRKLSLMYEKR